MSTLVTTFVLVVALLLQSGPAQRTFSGVVTDSECPDADHAGMHMGDTAAECAKACMDYHAATLLLYDGKRSLRLSDQKAVLPFAGQKVSVVGTLDDASNTIAVMTISLAK